MPLNREGFKQSMPLNLDEFKQAAEANEFIDVPVESWGGKEVRLQKLIASHGVKLARQYESLPKTDAGALADDDDLVAFYVALLSCSIVDGKGERMFPREEGRDVLRKLPFDVMVELGVAALQLNGFDGEDAKKNSTAQSGDSPSDSAETSE